MLGRLSCDAVLLLRLRGGMRVLRGLLRGKKIRRTRARRDNELTLHLLSAAWTAAKRRTHLNRIEERTGKSLKKDDS